MANKNIWSAITALALIFGITLAAHGQDRSLDGTWHSAEGLELRLDNGNLELHLNYHDEFETGTMLMARGIFTVSGGNITVTYTHYHGAFLNEMGMTAFGIRSVEWYTLDEVEAAIRRSPGGEFMAPAMLAQLAPLFMTDTAPIINNSFTLEFGTFTRQ